ncbi:hypothetical protein AAFF_G00095530 [Aldrovandia affinis]|uniref:Uncharacterized protein n=1 Tax=Aldrovandia affinis TaxID=143900 RepID=A0AAD7WCQ0_9TELE|nr:hypothetical protein AAFF_G00095530 [Aldrovandia affinis]
MGHSLWFLVKEQEKRRAVCVSCVLSIKSKAIVAQRAVNVVTAQPQEMLTLPLHPAQSLADKAQSAVGSGFREKTLRRGAQSALPSRRESAEPRVPGRRGAVGRNVPRRRKNETGVLSIIPISQFIEQSGQR